MSIEQSAIEPLIDEIMFADLKTTAHPLKDLNFDTTIDLAIKEGEAIDEENTKPLSCDQGISQPAIDQQTIAAVEAEEASLIAGHDDYVFTIQKIEAACLHDESISAQQQFDQELIASLEADTDYLIEIQVSFFNSSNPQRS